MSDQKVEDEVVSDLLRAAADEKVPYDRDILNPTKIALAYYMNEKWDQDERSGRVARLKKNPSKRRKNS